MSSKQHDFLVKKVKKVKKTRFLGVSEFRTFCKKCANLCTFVKTGFFVKTHFFAFFSKNRGSSMQYLGVSLGHFVNINKLLRQTDFGPKFGGGQKTPEGCGSPSPLRVRSTPGAPGGVGGENLKTGVFKCVGSFFLLLFVVCERKKSYKA